MDYYYGTLSGNSARSAFALGEAGVAYTPHPIAAPHGENREAPYLALNPMGKVPALVDGDLQLWESNAINWYLAEKHPAARLLPASIAGRASVQRWLMFQASHVTPACAAFYRRTNQRVRTVWKADSDDKQFAFGRSELGRYLPVLDQALAGRDWLEGDFSLADIAYAPHLAMVAQGEAGYDFAPTPNVQAWLKRLWARPAWQKAVEMSLAGAV
ncbi:MAG TPA: glutathione S-transferase family protein [Polyangia bacterium]|nr:glutathione S-transferase family protein [Polyangia bacterium]